MKPTIFYLMTIVYPIENAEDGYLHPPNFYASAEMCEAHAILQNADPRNPYLEHMESAIILCTPVSLPHDPGFDNPIGEEDRAA